MQRLWLCYVIHHLNCRHYHNLTLHHFAVDFDFETLHLSQFCHDFSQVFLPKTATSKCQQCPPTNSNILQECLLLWYDSLLLFSCSILRRTCLYISAGNQTKYPSWETRSVHESSGDAWLLQLPVNGKCASYTWRKQGAVGKPEAHYQPF